MTVGALGIPHLLHISTFIALVSRSYAIVNLSHPSFRTHLLNMVVSSGVVLRAWNEIHKLANELLYSLHSRTAGRQEGKRAKAGRE